MHSVGMPRGGQAGILVASRPLDRTARAAYQHGLCVYGENGLIRRWIAAMREAGVVRRIFAIVCMAAFLTVGLAHSLQHLDALAVAAQDVSPGDTPDAPKKAPAAAEHCFACTMLAIPAPEQAVLPAPTTQARAVPRDMGMHTHPPNAETRPPIRTI